MRDLSWGGPRARALLHDIAADAAARAGFRVAAIEVVRPQGLLEFVAITGEPEGSRQLLGTGSRLEDMVAAIGGGEAFGSVTFVAEESYAPGLEERLRDGSWIPDIPRTDDPGDWQPLDMLVAEVRDERGSLRALFYLDEPFGLKRPSRAELEALSPSLSLTLSTVVTVIEREEFAHLVRSIRAARRVVQSSPARHDVNHLLREARETLLDALAVDELEIHVFLDEEVDQPDSLGLEIDGNVCRALHQAAARAWTEQRVVIIEPGQVWGDTALAAEHADWFTEPLLQLGYEALVIAPMGVDDDVLGMLLCARRTGSRRWTDGEGLAALELGHDLGRAVANAHATQRERRLLEELRELEAARHWFLRELTHEINNPMTVIAANAEFLATNPAADDRDVRRAQAILRGTERLGDLLQGLSMLSRVSDPHRPPTMERFDLVGVVEETISSMAAVAEKAGITLHVVGDTTGAFVLGDVREIAGAVTNLVDNAVKYSDPDHEIWLGVERREDGGLTFSCRDEGIGISEADQANLFAPLFRSTNDQALLRPGTGLGLGIVREIMQRHGGSVEISSALGHGTTVRLHFRP
ncbi:GAF domain-containing sensor histidine kinase [Nocardioides sp. S-58]|uniref:Sensor-like histidine kinase SenX3 n=1 Tax=Nocardioides renjunii TaxID=3095075 RepID=A0ABU5K9N9_9ACTN|nr:GAF domain-containing sensor histidine kinase [Nocardioides sp. S-58]MDZ5661564.1 GAF domain-containing sensor histidine kinase [Nocardioides sp. S-58]